MFGDRSLAVSVLAMPAACGSAVRSACPSPAAIPPHLCRDESRQKCSGQPGYGRPGRWRRHCRIPLTLHPPKTAPEDRCQASPSTSCCYSPWVMGRPGPGPGGRLPSHTVSLFRCSREPKVSLPRRSRARRPTLPDRLRGQHSVSLRVLGHLETQRLAPASRQAETSTTSPAPPTSL